MQTAILWGFCLRACNCVQVCIREPFVHGHKIMYTLAIGHKIMHTLAIILRTRQLREAKAQHGNAMHAQVVELIKGLQVKN